MRFNSTIMLSQGEPEKVILFLAGDSSFQYLYALTGSDTDIRKAWQMFQAASQSKDLETFGWYGNLKSDLLDVAESHYGTMPTLRLYRSVDSVDAFGSWETTIDLSESVDFDVSLACGASWGPIIFNDRVSGKISRIEGIGPLGPYQAGNGGDFVYPSINWP